MLLQKIKELFDIEVISSSPLMRDDDNSTVNLFLESQDGKKYFLKEVQSHSMREDFDHLYATLTRINTDRFKLVLPINLKSDPSKFKFESKNKVYLLFKKEKLLPFEIKNYPLNKLINDLIYFHSLIEKYTFSKSDYRSYESWLAIGAKRFRKKYNQNLPFLDSFENFMSERFSKINFQTGNIHWDIHQDNLALDKDGKLIILDFDLLQEGALITDIAAAASMYIDFNFPEKNENNQIYQETFKLSSNLATGMDLSDFNFLIKRCILGDLALIDSKDELINKLKKLEYNI